MCRRVSKSQSSYRRQPHLIVSIRNQIVARLCARVYSRTHACVHGCACHCSCMHVFIRPCMGMSVAGRARVHVRTCLFACVCVCSYCVCGCSCKRVFTWPHMRLFIATRVYSSYTREFIRVRMYSLAQEPASGSSWGVYHNVDMNSF